MKKPLLILSVFAMLLLQGCYVHGHIGGDDRGHHEEHHDDHDRDHH
ncbi:MAG TPA: hypothetical protein VNZ45_11640 [Bacteroidia bacterium]|jgi:hypothetical protein|nr:hypothetical protein [Bacteroidia bacterium]